MVLMAMLSLLIEEGLCQWVSALYVACNLGMFWPILMWWGAVVCLKLWYCVFLQPFLLKMDLLKRDEVEVSP